MANGYFCVAGPRNRVAVCGRGPLFVEQSAPLRRDVSLSESVSPAPFLNSMGIPDNRVHDGLRALFGYRR